MLLVKTCFLLFHSSRIQVGSLPKCKIPFCAIWKVSSASHVVTLNITSDLKTGTSFPARALRVVMQSKPPAWLQGETHQQDISWQSSTKCCDGRNGRGCAEDWGEVWSGAGERALLCSSTSEDAEGCWPTRNAAFSGAAEKLWSVVELEWCRPTCDLGRFWDGWPWAPKLPSLGLLPGSLAGICPSHPTVLGLGSVSRNVCWLVHSLVQKSLLSSLLCVTGRFWLYHIWLSVCMRACFTYSLNCLICFSFDLQNCVLMYLLQDYIMCTISSFSGSARKVDFELLAL